MSALIIRKKSSKKWTANHVQQFIKDYPSFTDEDLCIMYETNHLKVQQIALEYCLGKNKKLLPGDIRMPRWTKDQLKLLKKIYPDHDNLKVAKRLGRTVKSVVSKAFYMNVKKNAEQLAKTARLNVACRGPSIRVVKALKKRKAAMEKRKKERAGNENSQTV